MRADGATQHWHAHADAYDRYTHPLRIVPQPWLSAVYAGATEGMANSIHHRGVERLGDGLAVDAYADDGVVEAIHGDASGFACFLLIR